MQNDSSLATVDYTGYFVFVSIRHLRNYYNLKFNINVTFMCLCGWLFSRESCTTWNCHYKFSKFLITCKQRNNSFIHYVTIGSIFSYFKKPCFQSSARYLVNSWTSVRHHHHHVCPPFCLVLSFFLAQHLVIPLPSCRQKLYYPMLST